MESKRPKDFFYLMFDDRMFDTVADRTNEYARNKILNVMQGREPCEQMDDLSNKKQQTQ